ncbi:MAG: linear amide C-N hydrolase [Cyanobacteriota bacterium]|nr:linear amide C-N hydrolase [Cyanobacteriota bacterium]
MPPRSRLAPLLTADNRRSRLSIATLTRYGLSQSASVKDLVRAIAEDHFQIVPVPFGLEGKAKATVHLAVSDASGDSAVTVDHKGKPVIDHGPQFQVMTNSHVYSERLKLNTFWSSKDRNPKLPGWIQSPDCFIRGSCHLQLLLSSDPRPTLAEVIGVMHNISVPCGIPDPEHPNIAPGGAPCSIGETLYEVDSAPEAPSAPSPARPTANCRATSPPSSSPPRRSASYCRKAEGAPRPRTAHQGKMLISSAENQLA